MVQVCAKLISAGDTLPANATPSIFGDGIETGATPRAWGQVASIRRASQTLQPLR